MPLLETAQVAKDTSATPPSSSSSAKPTTASATVIGTNNKSSSGSTSSAATAATYVGKQLTLPERAFLLKDASRIQRINAVALLIVFLPYLTYLLNEG